MKIRKNGKVITLSESDLNRIVKRYLNEEEKENQLELLLCLADALDMTYSDVAESPNCLKAATDIAAGDFPDSTTIMLCTSELKELFEKKCGNDIVKCLTELPQKMEKCTECIMKFK